jgi:hypothetical protein
VKMLAGIARGARRAVAPLTIPAASTAAMLAALFAVPAHGADLDYGPYGPRPYGYQPPPYDYRGPAYPPGRYVPDRRGGYGEQYGYQSYDRRVPPYPAYRVPPVGYDHEYREYRGYGGYGRYGYAEPYYDPYGGPPRPPAPIMGPPRGWVGDPRELPDDRWVDAAPPYETWSPYPPGRW